MIVKPKRPLKLAKISGNRNDAIAVVRTGRLAQVILIARQPNARHVAPSKGDAPVVVVESSGKMIGVAGAVTLGAIMRIVEMRRYLVAAEPTIGSAICRQIVVNSGHNRLAVSRLEQARRAITGPSPIARSQHSRRPWSERPHGIWILLRHFIAELGARLALADRHQVTDLRIEFLPSLVRE